MDSKNTYNDGVYKEWLAWRLDKEKAHDKFQQKVKDARAGGQEGPINGKTRPTSFLHQMNELIVTLESKELLPALFFVLSRKDCEKYARKVESTLITSSEKSDVNHIWNFHLRNHKESLEKLPQYHSLRALLDKGIAYHHSGLVPMLKEIIEILFSKGFIKVLFATETFAVGINMPTKTAVFVGVKKYDDLKGDMRVLSTAEYLQMAGRAGRRGLDTMGTVIYLPDRNPIEPSEMRLMMCGGRAEVTSRMEFDYDFILKTLHSGNRTWLDIMEKSYWRRQRQVQIDELKRAQKSLETRNNQLILSEDEMEAVQQKVDLETQLTHLTNAKKKKAELQLNKWKDEHRGMKWENALQAFSEIQLNNMKLQKNKEAIGFLEDTSTSVENKIRVLESLDYLKPMDNPKSHTKESLTTKGILATELNECDSLLISQFYLSENSKKLEPMELLAVLAGCIVDGKKDNEVPLQELNVPQIVKDTLYDMSDIWDSVRRAENQNKSSESSWKMGTTWVAPLWDWMNGESVARICANYQVYEGNLIRSVLKLQNMLDEWRSMASFCEHTDVLDKLKDANQLLVREAVIQDSLYLHL